MPENEAAQRVRVPSASVNALVLKRARALAQRNGLAFSQWLEDAMIEKIKRQGGSDG